MGLTTTPASGSGTTPVTSRKRGARACDACRAQRSRCSGETPSCARCQSNGIPCYYTLSFRQHRTEERRRRRLDSNESLSAPERQGEIGISAHSTPTTIGSEAVLSPTTSSLEQHDQYENQLRFVNLSLIYTRFLGCSKATVRQHIDAYFEYVYPVPVFSFLHRAELLSQYTTGMISSALQFAEYPHVSYHLQTKEGVRHDHGSSKQSPWSLRA
jgi:hypothetical protein